MSFQLFPYQREGVAAAQEKGGRLLLADEMGLGKSVQALAYGRAVGAQRTLIVCPASLKSNWQVEAATHFNQRVEVLNGRTLPKEGRMVNHRPPMLVVNYDILFAWHRWLIEKYQPDYLIGDEIQALGNPRTKRTKAMRRLAVAAPRYLALSGGPIENHTIQFWPTLNMLWPHEFPSFVEFGERYCRRVASPWGVRYEGACRGKELNARLRSLGYVRRLVADVLKDLPPLRVQVTPMEASPDPTYYATLADYKSWFQNTYGLALRGADEQRRRATYMRLLARAAVMKMPAVLDWLDQFLLSGEKIILFAHHHAMVDLLAKHLATRKCKAVRLDGRVTGKARDVAKATFMNDPRCQVLIGEHKAAGEGHTLTAARFVGFVELPWSPVLMRQCIKRIHRIGQTRPCQAFVFVARGTVEEKLCRVLRRKEKDIDSVVDGHGRAAPVSMFDVLDRLL